MRLGLSGQYEGVTPISAFIGHNISKVIPRLGLHKKYREARNQVFSILTHKEQEYAGFHFLPESYKPNTNPLQPGAKSSQIVKNFQKAHHIGEATTLRPDGTRYIYGIPAYNTKQVEATFNIAGNSRIGELAYYTPGTDDTKNNHLGLDHYFHKTRLPAYAHTYLLTEVLSPDYVDAGQDGVTPDDLGTVVKFNYSKIYGNDSNTNGCHKENFRWRTPYGNTTQGSLGIVSFEEGAKTNAQDNKGSYVYGEKEMWIFHSIVTKNYVAQFYISDRKDGLGVKGEAGAPDTTQKIKKLDSIVLYSRADVLMHGMQNAIPIKAVHFEYDYSMCRHIPNHVSDTTLGSGKLTLKKMYFTYGKSRKGKFSPYLFSYTHNYDYNFAYKNRWGGYKPESGSLTNKEFPYTDASVVNKLTGRSDISDQWAMAWNMDQVELPSGGTIRINYEADDYAYVQDKEAMQMFKILGVGRDASYGTQLSNSLYAHDGSFSNNYVFFRLPFQVSQSEFKPLFFRNLKQAYLNCMINVDPKHQSAAKEFEHIPIYTELEDAGLADIHGSGTSDVGWVRLKPLKMEDDDDHSQDIQAITKNAWQYEKVNFPEKIYPGSNNNLEKNKFGLLKGLLSEVSKLANGFYYSLRNQGYASVIKPDQSWIRLFSPLRMKPGGGCRVKKIALSDNWGNMKPANDKTNEYGQVFDYTKKIQVDKREYTISSGVATYEPMFGNDENPFFEVTNWTKENRGAIDDFNITTLPIGESFMPDASVGYSSVRVMDLKHDGVTGTGHTLHEFYTSHEFPTIILPLELKIQEERPGQVFDNNFSGSDAKDYMGISQGFSILLNDMHGKPKRKSIYGNESENFISSVEYVYEAGNSKELSPVNNETIINCNGTVGKAGLGIDVDVTIDTRQSISTTTSRTYGSNIDWITFPYVPVPIPLPSNWPSANTETSQFSSAGVTKVIHQAVFLKSIIAIDEHSKIQTNNLAYDKETGECILTQTINQFNDTVYNFTYPAYWAYNGMGPSYKNINVKFDKVRLDHGDIQVIDNPAINLQETFNGGDELLIQYMVWHTKGWILEIGNSYKVIDAQGDLVDIPFCSMKVIRSGKKNLSSVPIGTVTCMANPIKTGRLKFEKVLNTSATEFSDQWQLFSCGFKDTSLFKNCNRDQLGTLINPYLKGVKGIWRKKRDWVYYDQRKQTMAATNIRKDGLLRSFSLFWKNNGKNYMEPNDTSKHWTWANEVTRYSPYGFELENRDALGIYSAALYGYNNSFPMAIASNAKYREIAYDGFEDYTIDGLMNPGNDFCHRSYHWNLVTNLKPANGYITQAIHHTGRKALLVKAGKTVVIRSRLSNCQMPDYSDINQENQYFIRPSDCIGTFAPDSAKDYFLSLWVKKDLPANQCYTSYSDTMVQVKYPGVSGTRTIYLLPQGPIIEGWQKVESKIPVRGSGDSLIITLRASGNKNVVFDDLRFHPFKSNMKSFVYDPVSFRLVSEMDANNFASFYEYDYEGKLVRVKKETVKGIMTIKETRMNTQRIK